MRSYRQGGEQCERERDERETDGEAGRLPRGASDRCGRLRWSTHRRLLACRPKSPAVVYHRRSSAMPLQGNTPRGSVADDRAACGGYGRQGALRDKRRS